MKKRIQTIDYLAMLILILSPVLGIYGNPSGWSFEMLLVIPLSALYFVSYIASNSGTHKIINPLPKGVLVYFIYWAIVLSLLSVALPFSVIQCYLAFFLFFSTFYLGPFIKMYKAVALISIVFFFAQEVSFQLSGIRISGIISALPFYGSINMDEYMSGMLSSARSSSFFSEPAHFAQFLLPLLSIELFYDRRRGHILISAMICLTLILLQSGNALFGMLSVLIFYVPYLSHRNIKKGKRFWLIMGFIIVALLSSYYFINSEMGLGLLERQKDLDVENGDGSGYLRIWRGLFVYNDYSLIEKIIGCPNDVLQLAHVKSAGVLTIGSDQLYFNAFQSILLNTGLVGLSIFIFIIAKLWNGNSICGKAILFSLCILSLMAAIYMTHTMILYLVVADSMKKMNSNQLIQKSIFVDEKSYNYTCC